MNKLKLLLVAFGFIGAWQASADSAQTDTSVKLPPFKQGQYQHRAPDKTALLADDIHPELQKMILKGRDIFLNTQQLRGKHVFNDMSCKSCHMGEGRLAWAGPVWAAAVTLPDYRGKNKHVNTIEERIAGCFTYSMNGKPPAYDSEIMYALVAYHTYLAKGAPMYQKNIAGRGFRHLGKKVPEATSYANGEKTYQQNCMVCHGENGQGRRKNNKVVFPPLWGKNSYNWGAGMSRIFTAASFIKNNMPYGQPGYLTDQQAWDLAFFINSHERPQDPRFTKDIATTRKKYLNFHKHTLYGTKQQGKLLGQGAK